MYLRHTASNYCRLYQPMNWLAIPLAYLWHAFPCCAALLCDLCPLGYALGPQGRLLSVTEQGGDAFVA